ncbi:MAG: hypothetical protein IT372_17025 [Polyangiaceae bacterium]|nr:hypothetical protein [Polyangiaceae bacterium]
MVRLELAGADSRILSPLCARCPQGPAGCCASPPAFAWADIGRVVLHGGLEWLLGEIRAGRLRPGARGLSILRPGEPARCAYHEAAGCTIPPERRSATCNYYLCGDALEAGGEPQAARAAVETLTGLYGRWDVEIGERVRGLWPEGPAWDQAFLEWLGEEQRRRLTRDRRALGRLRG